MPTVAAVFIATVADKSSASKIFEIYYYVISYFLTNSMIFQIKLN